MNILRLLISYKLIKKVKKLTNYIFNNDYKFYKKQLKFKIAFLKVYITNNFDYTIIILIN